jgi:hypothetical protein
MFWTFNAEHFSAPDSTGGSERALLNQGNGDPDNITTQGANEFVHGVPTDNPLEHGNNGGSPQFVHNNTTGGLAITPDGKAYCQKGQQGYAYGVNRFRPDGYEAYRRDVIDQPLYDPNVQFGSTWAKFDRNGHGSGRSLSRVPEGETFTQTPGGIAAQLPEGGRPNKLDVPPWDPPHGESPAP